MNSHRFLLAAAGSALLAAVLPSTAQAADLGDTLSSTAQTASAVGEEAGPVVEGVIGDKVNRKVNAAKGVVKGSTDAVKSGRELLS
ncbi:hypothetical protein [Streptomyces lushanensis]|uniref:hypothetical protein n=1 Tax=Streptomyces lushanensis TaxID=1434255 RepID=UPI00083292F5|nr:hypothetical protein [Streptomyces lushanensis]